MHSYRVLPLLFISSFIWGDPTAPAEEQAALGVTPSAGQSHFVLSVSHPSIAQQTLLWLLHCLEWLWVSLGAEHVSKLYSQEKLDPSGALLLAPETRTFLFYTTNLPQIPWLKWKSACILGVFERFLHFDVWKNSKGGKTSSNKAWTGLFYSSVCFPSSKFSGKHLKPQKLLAQVLSPVTPSGTAVPQSLEKLDVPWSLCPALCYIPLQCKVP